MNKVQEMHIYKSIVTFIIIQTYTFYTFIQSNQFKNIFLISSRLKVRNFILDIFYDNLYIFEVFTC